MNLKHIILVVGAVGVVLLFFLFRPGQPIEKPQPANNLTEQQPLTEPPASIQQTSALTSLRPRSTIKHRASEFTKEENAAFAANFELKYKPALLRWGKAFEGHVPFKPGAVTVGHLYERIGKNSSYNEYIFVVDGITLGVRDKNGDARVDYLNVPQQTQKMAVLPSDGQSPILASPVTPAQIAQMVEAEGGKKFASHEIRIIPSGLSGSMNGGALVSVGGDPENGASWSYDMAFGPDGNLAYYLKGIRDD